MSASYMGTRRGLMEEKKEIGFIATEEIAHHHRMETTQCNKSSWVANPVDRKAVKAALPLPGRGRPDLDQENLVQLETEGRT